MDYITKRSNVAKQMRDMLDLAKTEKRGLTADEKVKYDNMLDEINSLDEQNKREKELAEIEARNNFVPDPQIAKQVEMKSDPKAEGRAEMRTFLEKGIFPEERTMSSSDGATGGYMIPEVLADMLLEYAKNNAVIRSLATVESWKGDGAFPVVTDFGTSYLVSEGNKVTETTPTLAEKTVSGYQLMYAVDVPRKLIYNSKYALESKMMGWWAKSNSNLEETYWASGDGSGKPIGLTAAGTAGTVTASNSAIAGDDIVNWYYDLPQVYRGMASWIFADKTIAKIRKMKNPVTTSGALNYIWMPGLGGSPDTLMGRPIYASAGMADFAAGAKVGVFGDIKQYQIVEFGSPTMIRDEYTRAKYGEISFIGHRLVDAALPVAEAVSVCTIKS